MDRLIPSVRRWSAPVPSNKHELTFNPNPLQRSFIESRALADLFSSRVGEGKSAALAWSVYYHTRHNPGANWVMIRDTFENIQKSTQKEFFKWFPPGVFGTYHATKKEFTWADGVAKGTVVFLGMDDPQDATKLMSMELAGIAMDEPAPAVGSAGIDELIFDIGMTRMRQPGMNWYAVKLATNNPDESHWTFKKFVSPGIEGFRVWQPPAPENLHNLPEGYYETLRRTLANRPDLIRRFVDGEFGFQSEGKAVTPQWNDKFHLATGLVAMPRQELILLWDFGHNPTCIITQKTPMGHWHILESFVGEGIGVAELIADAVKPTLAQRYRGHPLRHIGDPAGTTGEQTSIHRSAVKFIRAALGGTWRSGPTRLWEGIEPLRWALSQNLGGQALVRVNRERAKEVWYALRGGWAFHVTRTGITSGEPSKNIHSHPGDAMRYGAAILFPMGKLVKQGNLIVPQNGGGYFSANGGPGRMAPDPAWRIGPAHNGAPLPKHGQAPIINRSGSSSFFGG